MMTLAMKPTVLISINSPKSTTNQFWHHPEVITQMRPSPLFVSNLSKSKVLLTDLSPHQLNVSCHLQPNMHPTISMDHLLVPLRTPTLTNLCMLGLKYPLPLLSSMPTSPRHFFSKQTTLSM